MTTVEEILQKCWRITRKTPNEMDALLSMVLIAGAASNLPLSANVVHFMTIPY